MDLLLLLLCLLLKNRFRVSFSGFHTVPIMDARQYPVRFFLTLYESSLRERGLCKVASKKNTFNTLINLSLKN